MPATKNKLRIGMYKRGRPRKLKAEQKNSATRKGPGRPPSDDRFLASQIYLALQSPAHPRDPTTVRGWVLRLMRLSHLSSVKRNKNAKKRSEWKPSDLDWTQDAHGTFKPSGPRGVWLDEDFSNHSQFNKTYRNVLRHLKRLKGP